jgi:hypothetical protein
MYLIYTHMTGQTTVAHKLGHLLLLISLESSVGIATANGKDSGPRDSFSYKASGQVLGNSKQLENTAFRNLDLFPSSGGGKVQ